jgi:hypothetical protein
MPPVGEITEKIDEDSRSNRRPIELIGSSTRVRAVRRSTACGVTLRKRPNGTTGMPLIVTARRELQDLAAIHNPHREQAALRLLHLRGRLRGTRMRKLRGMPRARLQ